MPEIVKPHQCHIIIVAIISFIRNDEADASKLEGQPCDDVC
jgi:hypothetical protein